MIATNVRRLALGIIAAVLACPCSLAQTSATTTTFAVVSIKPNKSGEIGTVVKFTDDGLVMRCVPARNLLLDAFGINGARLIGAPGWAETDRYDVDAKVAPEDAPSFEHLKGPERMSLLLPVLEDRFRLRFHHETKELPVYALMIAKGGSKLKAKDDVAPRDSGDGGRMTLRPGNLEAHDAKVELLLGVLTGQLHRTIVDKTGLPGRYDFTLQWTPDVAPLPLPTDVGSDAEGTANENRTANDSAPGIFTALQEQLGLKLESEKDPIDVIVIDHIDRPSEN
ncbi:MAG: TIGR03435 family protein [Terracidiphilus sp.]